MPHGCRAPVTRDRATLREHYKPDWKAWLGDNGGEVTAESATYLKVNSPRVVTLFKVAKAIASGTPPKAGDLGYLDRGELSAGQGRT